MKPVAAEQATGTINDLLTIILRQLGEYRACEHIAAVGRLVSQYPVVKQINPHAAAFAKKRRGCFLLQRERFAGFCEIDMPGQVIKTDVFTYFAVFIEQGLS